MNNQLVNTNNLIQGIALAILGILLAVLVVLLGISQFSYSDPYVHDVLELTGDTEQGQAIFQMNCASCHGMGGDGRVGPSLHHISDRKSRVGLIHQVTSGQTPPMPQFQPSPQEMADLLQYLESL
ncbi:cytochrome c [Leptolyngbya sp. FACHB-671]|uniref:c-type cytochrome n=1 Tax=unclassified Leptolyngbya TaxID=2650499 RepID=UPI0016884E9C|nr:cytochrome c [Cyanobacteria bacterium FACHB-471]MBD1997533.1 cytochrome c [Leptolyngbya sp. FACHB-541]MBD2070342.1 cytochrome c [Leptolyngbya sp. FACHB-671]